MGALGLEGGCSFLTTCLNVTIQREGILRAEAVLLKWRYGVEVALGRKRNRLCFPAASFYLCLYNCIFRIDMDGRRLDMAVPV